MKTPHDKQKEVTAATFKRLAKALRVRARNHKNSAKAMSKAGRTTSALVEAAMSNLYSGIASDCDHEATILRSMR